MPWQEIRFSGQLPDQTVSIRCQIENDCDTEIIFEAENGLNTNLMYEIPGMNNTFQGFMQVPNVSRNYGFITQIRDPMPEQVAFMAAPVFNSSGETPGFQDITCVMEDISGDIGQGLSFLDIINAFSSFDEQKLYLAMQNNGGGYPVNNDTWNTFYSYMLLIMPPQETDVTFGMLFTINQPPYIQPGLYKMMGENYYDMQMMAGIEYLIDEENDLLIMECYWNDLLSDEDFTDWFDPDEPEFTFTVTTNMITMGGGPQDGDFSEQCSIYPHRFTAEIEENTIPQISNIEIIRDSILAFTYFDGNANFPLIAQAVIDDSIQVALYPQIYDYSAEVYFQTVSAVDVIENDLWQNIIVTVSDNYSEIVQETINNTDADPDLISDVAFKCYPNPFNPVVNISFTGYKSQENAKVIVYNTKGQCTRRLNINDGIQSVVWNGKDDKGNPVSSGVYYVNLSVDKKVIASEKCLLLK